MLPSVQTASSMKMLGFRMGFASAVWAASRCAGASCGVRLVLNGLAVPKKGVEGLDFMEEQAVINHVLVVGGQLGRGNVLRNQAEASCDGRVVVDQSTL